MKRLLAILLTLVLFGGCSKQGSDLERSMEFRDRLLKGNGCSFDATVTADYDDVLYTFSLQCSSDAQGTLTFTVKSPESISGIQGVVSEEGGKLTFSDQALVFSTMADELLTPVSGPWILVKALRGGYINSCAQEEAYYHISVDDSYEAQALRLDVWMDESMLPVRGEILWNNRRILTMEITDFCFM